MIPPHPAPFSDELMPVFKEMLVGERGTILDPFAGIGRVHELRHDTLGIELHKPWADAHPRTIHGDSTQLCTLIDRRRRIGTILTSPAYASRMGDTYDGRSDAKAGKKADGTPRPPRLDTKGRPKRRSYRIALGDQWVEYENDGGAMQWNDDYRALHRAVWRECAVRLVPGGAFILNIKDHVRGRRRRYVSSWHVETLLGFGLVFEECKQVGVKGYKYGANRDARVNYEYVFKFRKPGEAT